MRRSSAHRHGWRVASRRHYTWYNQKDFCPKFWYTATINVDGGLTPCCNFFFQEDDMGNVLEDGFLKVWEGERMQRYRSAVGRGDREALHPSCAACKVYQTSFASGLSASDYGVTRDDPRRSRAEAAPRAARPPR